MKDHNRAAAIQSDLVAESVHIFILESKNNHNTRVTIVVLRSMLRTSVLVHLPLSPPPPTILNVWVGPLPVEGGDLFMCFSECQVLAYLVLLDHGISRSVQEAFQRLVYFHHIRPKLLLHD